MVRYRDQDPDREDSWEKAAQTLETQAPVSPFPILRRGEPAIRPTIQQLIDFENTWAHRRTGTKEAGIRHTFGLTATRYHQYLNRAIDTEEALVADPVLINRLRDHRTKRLAARAARRPE